MPRHNRNAQRQFDTRWTRYRICNRNLGKRETMKLIKDINKIKEEVSKESV